MRFSKNGKVSFCTKFGDGVFLNFLLRESGHRYFEWGPRESAYLNTVYLNMDLGVLSECLACAPVSRCAGSPELPH